MFLKFCTMFSVVALCACTAMTPLPPLLTQAGQPIEFAGSDFTISEGVVYVLLEKKISGSSLRLEDEWHVIDISTSRLPIKNERQERIVFNRELTQFAIDFPHDDFTIYYDRGNYDQRTLVVDCRGVFARKRERYSLCNSEFSEVFIPMSVTKNYAMGRMSYRAHKLWQHPEYNLMRVLASPEHALRQAGVFERLDAF